MPYPKIVKEKVRQLRAQGVSYPEIREQLELPADMADKLADRTMIRWAKASGPTPLPVQEDTLSPLDAWPAERQCPGWTVDDLTDLPGFRSDLWAVNIELIHASERQRNVYVPWFFRNLIELARRRDMPDGSLPWSVAIAGLPVLDDWLNCPPCTELAELAEKHQPWAGRRQRAAYRREARTVAVAVTQCVLQAHARMAMDDYVQQKVSDSTRAIAELGKRIPLFDRVPLRIRSPHVGKLILDILVTPKES